MGGCRYNLNYTESIVHGNYEIFIVVYALKQWTMVAGPAMLLLLLLHTYRLYTPVSVCIMYLR